MVKHVFDDCPTIQRVAYDSNEKGLSITLIVLRVDVQKLDPLLAYVLYLAGAFIPDS